MITTPISEGFNLSQKKLMCAEALEREIKGEGEKNQNAKFY